MANAKTSQIEIVGPKKRLVIKPPKHIRARQFLADLDDVLGNIGLEECTISIQKGKKHFKGRTRNGKAINVILRDGGSGFQEQTVSFCDVLSVKDRRVEAKRLRKEGMRQTVIAERLGVSQKTISNDLCHGTDQ
ncbi:helix-turn-helix domain-containing protein [Mesorhizobium sp. STM 4661]|uniref:helix-turn-helix domain-containing protein n=1 Tax=Mesorhizobium sp. STM 4661 TaxID=1297570 RepID=UPI00055A857E|nr:helix-turn-helix domain-containing protein [Mesorhizobium sp. STM 4661]